jgi:hypothetical protein
LTEVVYVEAAGEVDGAGARFGQFQASVDGILHDIDADSEQRDLAFVGAGWASWPDRDAGAASALDRPDAARVPGAAEILGHFGVMITSVHGNSAVWQIDEGLRDYTG